MAKLGDSVRKEPPVPTWQGKEYPKHECGERMVRVIEVDGPTWLTKYGRWAVRLGAHFMDEPGEVSCFLNLGNDRDELHVGRQSRYYKAWTLANGGPPEKDQPMPPDTFLGKVFLAKVEDSTLAATLVDGKREQKPADEVYSVIRELLHSPQTPQSGIRNQESGIKKQKNLPNQANQPNQGCHRDSFSSSASAGRGLTPSQPQGGEDSLLPAQAISLIDVEGSQDKVASARGSWKASDD